MDSVSRTRGIRKLLQGIVTGKPVQKYVTAGDVSCQIMMREARSQHSAFPSEQAMLAWARYDLSREILSGFWDQAA